MGENFERQKGLLHGRYGALSMDDRRQTLYKLRKRNILTCRQSERLKHDPLRLEPKRVQCGLKGNQTQVEVVETKILKKKEQFLKMLTQDKE